MTVGPDSRTLAAVLLGIAAALSSACDNQDNASNESQGAEISSTEDMNARPDPAPGHAAAAARNPSEELDAVNEYLTRLGRELARFNREYESMRLELKRLAGDNGSDESARRIALRMANHEEKISKLIRRQQEYEIARGRLEDELQRISIDATMKRLADEAPTVSGPAFPLSVEEQADASMLAMRADDILAGIAQTSVSPDEDFPEAEREADGPLATGETQPPPETTTGQASDPGRPAEAEAGESADSPERHVLPRLRLLSFSSSISADRRVSYYEKGESVDARRVVGKINIYEEEPANALAAYLRSTGFEVIRTASSRDGGVERSGKPHGESADLTLPQAEVVIQPRIAGADVRRGGSGVTFVDIRIQYSIDMRGDGRDALNYQSEVSVGLGRHFRGLDDPTHAMVISHGIVTREVVSDLSDLISGLSAQ